MFFGESRRRGEERNEKILTNIHLPTRSPTSRTDRLAPDWVDPRIDAKAEMERHLKEKAAKAAKAAPKKQKTAAE